MSERELDIQIGVQLETPDISIGIGDDVPDIEIAVESGGDHYETYEGEYEVESRIGETQVLPVKAKIMRDDIVVDEIPVYQVSNEAGGYTYYIGR